MENIYHINPDIRLIVFVLVIEKPGPRFTSKDVGGDSNDKATIISLALDNHLITLLPNYDFIKIS